MNIAIEAKSKYLRKVEITPAYIQKGNQILFDCESLVLIYNYDFLKVVD